MRSTDLPTYGFGLWLPFSKERKVQLLHHLPLKPGVYAIRCVREITRRHGASDLIYFGKATNQKGIKNRIGQYFSPGPTQRTNARILALIGECEEYQLAFAETPSIPEAVMLEASLLERYVVEHGELPPENKRR